MVAAQDALTVATLARMYLAHARTYYRRRDGVPTGEHRNIASNLTAFVRITGEDLPAASIEKHQLRAFSAELIAKNCTRSYVNQSLSRVKRMYRWASDQDLIPPAALAVVESIRNLPAFRSDAREPEPRQPAVLAHVAQTLPLLPAIPRDVVQLLLLTGARIGEILQLRNVDLVTDDPARWYAIPPHHKTLHHGARRVVPFDARCIAIIEPRRRAICPEDFLFPSPRNPEIHYRRDSVLIAIRRACTRADVPQWCPHQLRHTVATIVRDRRSLEHAQVLLGHSRRSTTERYAHVDPAKAFDAQAALWTEDDA